MFFTNAHFEITHVKKKPFCKEFGVHHKNLSLCKAQYKYLFSQNIVYADDAYHHGYRRSKYIDCVFLFRPAELQSDKRSREETGGAGREEKRGEEGGVERGAGRREEQRRGDRRRRGGDRRRGDRSRERSSRRRKEEEQRGAERRRRRVVHW